MAKIFKISDLISSSATAEPIVPATTSSFKMSNKANAKPVAKKKQCSSTDILYLHDQKMRQLEELQDSLPKKIKELSKPNLTSQAVQKLQDEIKSIENREEETEYLLSTSRILSEYQRVMHDQNDSDMKQDTYGNINKFIQKYDNIEKQRLEEDYCRIVNNGVIDTKKLVIQVEFCNTCGIETSFLDGFMTCSQCGQVTTDSICDFQLSYRDFADTSYKSPFTYKRTNRYHEILSTLQAKENVIIPDSVIEAVKHQIEKEHEVDLEDLTRDKIKYYLKKLGLTNYYEHIPHILNKINGRKPVQLPLEVEEKLLFMFKLIQDPFEIVKEKVAPSRLSFLSYNFVLIKFCELLDLHEYKGSFTLLKSIDKLRVQDKIWKGICEILEWEFIPSI